MKLARYIPFLGQTRYPAWMRLVSRSREESLEENIAMPIADPLWMLGRQWQFGEFKGEDNGSPVQVSVRYRSASIDQLSINEHDIPYDGQTPLEAMVEYIPPQLSWHDRARIGRQFEHYLKEITKKLTTNINWQQIIPKDYFLQPDLGSLDESTARYLRLLAGRCLDGKPLVDRLGHRQNISGFSANEQSIWNQALDQLQQWWTRIYASVNLPPDTTSWQDEALQHAFKIGVASNTPSRKASLNAPDYQSGHLDWYTFDQYEAPRDSVPGNLKNFNAFPTNLSFAGMPNKRLYAFEDYAVNFARMHTETSDLSKLMLMEFALSYSNDWFVLPLDLTLGTLTTIESLEITDVFGIPTSISSANSAVLNTTIDSAWDIFKVRKEHNASPKSVEYGLLIPPVVPHRESSKPREEVIFARDEYANMVWGIEEVMLNDLGKPVRGMTAQTGKKPVSSSTKYHNFPLYRLATKVPAHWIPYQPVWVEEGVMELQRAAMLTNDDSEAAEKIPARTSINRHIDRLREEVIPRAGVKVRITRQRARWWNGRTFLWDGREVVTGKGEENSGLNFDQLKWK